MDLKVILRIVARIVCLKSTDHGGNGKKRIHVVAPLVLLHDICVADLLLSAEKIVTIFSADRSKSRSVWGKTQVVLKLIRRDP